MTNSEIQAYAVTFLTVELGGLPVETDAGSVYIGRERDRYNLPSSGKSIHYVKDRLRVIVETYRARQ